METTVNALGFEILDDGDVQICVAIDELELFSEGLSALEADLHEKLARSINSGARPGVCTRHEQDSIQRKLNWIGRTRRMMDQAIVDIEVSKL